MAKGRNQEADFSRDIDRVLSGRETENKPAPDDEYRALLDFSGRIARSRATPPPAFQSSLKANLLTRLAEMDSTKVSEKPSSFKAWLSGLLRQRTLQVVGATLVVLIIALAISWKTGLFSPQRPVVTITSPVVAVEAMASIDNSSYTAGESVKISFTFINRSKEKLSFKFPPAFRIETLEANQVRSFPVGEITVSLQPDESASYSIAWDQTDTTGIQVPAGEYQIVLPNVKLGDAGFLSLPQAPNIIITGP